jgi:hypothetical protein
MASGLGLGHSPAPQVSAPSVDGVPAGPKNKSTKYKRQLAVGRLLRRPRRSPAGWGGHGERRMTRCPRRALARNLEQLATGNLQLATRPRHRHRHRHKNKKHIAQRPGAAPPAGRRLPAARGPPVTLKKHWPFVGRTQPAGPTQESASASTPATCCSFFVGLASSWLPAG